MIAIATQLQLVNIKALFFMIVTAIFTESADSKKTPFYCCSGVTVDDSLYTCKTTIICGVDDNECIRLKVLYEDHKVVVRGCNFSKACNATEQYETYKYFIMREPAVYNSKRLSMEVECCDKEKCNDNRTANNNVTADDTTTGDGNGNEESGTGSLKGLRFTLYLILVLIFAYF